MKPGEYRIKVDKAAKYSHRILRKDGDRTLVLSHRRCAADKDWGGPTVTVIEWMPDGQYRLRADGRSEAEALRQLDSGQWDNDKFSVPLKGTTKWHQFKKHFGRAPTATPNLRQVEAAGGC